MPNSMKRTNKLLRHRRLIFFFIFLFSVGIMLLPFFYKVQLQQFKSLGLFGIGLINFFGSATVFFPSPAILSVGIGGTLYNPILVALASSVGSSLGESVGFAFGYSSKKVINHKSEKRFVFRFLEFLFERHGTWMIILLAFIPNPIFDFAGIFAGMGNYPLKKFIVLVFVGRFTRDVLISFVFSRL